MRIALILAIMAFSNLSCEKGIFSSKDYPACIGEKIKEFKKEVKEACADGSTVKVYRFQEQEVFVFERGTCFSDFGVEVYDESCVLLCTLGTLLGITQCQGEAFENAVEIDVLWKG